MRWTLLWISNDPESETCHRGTEDTEDNIFGGTTVNSEPQLCDVCGSTDVVAIKCKVVCRNCGTILRSCADL
jgi:hypothetical protein